MILAGWGLVGILAFTYGSGEVVEPEVPIYWPTVTPGSGAGTAWPTVAPSTVTNTWPVITSQ